MMNFNGGVTYEKRKGNIEGELVIPIKESVTYLVVRIRRIV